MLLHATRTVGMFSFLEQVFCPTTPHSITIILLANLNNNPSLMPLPSVADLKTAITDYPIVDADEGAHRLLGSEVNAVYDAFVKALGTTVTTPAHQAGAWVRLIHILAEVGFASSYNPEGTLLKVVAQDGTVVTTKSIDTILNAMNAATPRYSHQRLSNSIPNFVADVIRAQRRETAWAKKNGIVVADIGHTFPGAIYCDPPPSIKDRKALTVASHVALNSSAGDDISTALPSTVRNLRQLSVPTSSAEFAL